MIYDIETEIERSNRKLQCIPIGVEPVETMFYIFAVRVKTEDGEIRRMLKRDKLYYLLSGFEVQDDRVVVDGFRYNWTVYDFYMGSYISKPHVSVSAIVGENGSGKSSLIEFEIRLINNLATVLFGEYSKEPGWEHLHYINDLHGELYYMYDSIIYKLAVNGRHVRLFSYNNVKKQENGCREYSLLEDDENILLDEKEDNKTPFKGTKTKLKKVLSKFFYTVVLNQSIYAYNTQDYSKECNSEDYEVVVRQCRNKDGNRDIPYTTESKCWLNGLFHKNDGYQIPIVLSPYRFEGNYNINRENELAYERLISLLVLSSEEFRIINSHLRVNCFVLKKKDHQYDIHYVHQELGYLQFGEKDFELMRDAILDTWRSTLELNDVPLRNGVHTALAKNYLVYKTLKIASKYDEYDEYKRKYFVEERPYDENDFRELVRLTIINHSHITNKLYRTFAFLIWNIFDVGGGGKFRVRIDDLAKRWSESRPKGFVLNTAGTGSLMLQSFIPPPFFEMSIELLELETREVVPFETLSSGEKQQAYTISSLLYHLKNLDSVGSDVSTDDRIKYQCVHLVLEEVELYFHPQLQKEFVRNLLDGLRQMNFHTIKWIDIRIVTHSPFVLSDIPTENVLTLQKANHDIGSIYCFGANIHEMLRNTFFLNNGTIGDFASWLIKRVAQCLCIHRWINKTEIVPTFFPSLKGELPKEYEFLKDFRKMIDGDDFNINAFNEVYGKDKLLRLIDMIEEPVVRRVLLDDYHRTFSDDIEGYKNSMEKMILSLQDQLKKLNE